MISGSTPLCRRTPCKVGVSEEVWLQRAQVVTDPSNHTEMFGRVDVTHKTMKLAVTFGRPFGDSRQATDGTQQVETAQPSSIKDLHKNLRCDRLQSPLIGGRRRHPPIFLTRLRRNSAKFNSIVVIALCLNMFMGNVIAPRCRFSLGSVIDNRAVHTNRSFPI